MPMSIEISKCSFQGVKRLESNNIYDTASNTLPAPSVTNGPIPYYPELKKLVPNVTSAILVAYFEMRFPAPQDALTRIASLPVTVPLDTVADALQISRRTLGQALCAICRVFPSEDRRSGAARVAREFLMPNHTRFGKIKLYSMICSGYITRVRTIILRRNLPMFRAHVEILGISSTYSPFKPENTQTVHAQQVIQPEQLAFPDGARARTSHSVSLAELLLRGSELAGDRRRTRYDRERKASGKPAKRRNTTLTKPNHGVEPELPEEVTGRLLHLRKDDAEDDLGSATGRRRG
ncbi:MAG: hypothetical protein KGL39_27485 [Patescibacteria group bacterium]|nr:hypothetical protein [Patescibacteria group bacterium]